MFCVSGVILNHRDAVSSCNISRSLLPSSYQFSHYNNGSIKGTQPLDQDSLIAFGNVGIWHTDKDFKTFKDFNNGMPKGMDGRNIKNIVRSSDGSLWAATHYDLFRYENERWNKVPIKGKDERISDITLGADSINLVVLTRSHIYIQNGSDDFRRITLGNPVDYKDETTLFKTFWQLHSGELFGTAGRIIVDIIAFVIVFLCLTGIVIFILPTAIGHRIRNGMKSTNAACAMRWNIKWHNRIGYYTIIFTLVIAFTGMCLRPPFMIPLVMVKTSPLPYSNLDSDNAWYDKLRGIRWDKAFGKWLISTSEGFVRANEDFSGEPVLITEQTPPVSPMGITVFKEENQGKWLIGSFSGLYCWDTNTNTITDYFSGAEYQGKNSGRPTSSHLVSGFTKDLNAAKDIVFDYRTGSYELPEQELLKKQPMSLWNAALELHVGRCYTPFLGPLSELFVFISGLMLILVLFTGLIIYNRHKHNTKINNQKVKQ